MDDGVIEPTSSSNLESSDENLKMSSEKSPLLHKNKQGYTIIIDEIDNGHSQGSKRSCSIIFNIFNFGRSKPDELDDEKHGSLVTIFTVWNTVMGTSLLTMAWGIERAGLIPGIMLLTLMGGLCLFTSYIILEVYKHTDNSSLNEISDLCNHLLGPGWRILSEIFSFLVMIGANIVYWVLMTSFLYHSVLSLIAYIQNKSSPDIPINSYRGLLCANKNISFILNNGTVESNDTDGGPLWNLYSTVPIYVSLLIFPLLNFKSHKFFKKFTSLGTLSVVYLLLFIIIKGSAWGLHVESWKSILSIKENFTALSGMLALSFYIHNIIITVMRSNAKQENNGRDLSIAFLLVIVTYLLAGTIFYVCFPMPKSCIDDNLLNNFVKSDLMTAVARVLLLFQIVTVFPLIAYMLRRQVFLLWNPAYLNSDAHIIIFNILLIVICILFACYVPKIGTIIRYTGALSGMVHIFTLPSLLQMTALYRRKELTAIKVIFYVLIFLLGLCNLFAQFFVVD